MSSGNEITSKEFQLWANILFYLQYLSEYSCSLIFKTNDEKCVRDVFVDIDVRS